MTWLASDAKTVLALVVKDWQVYQKQLAGYVLGIVLSLTLVGTGHASARSVGALLLLVLLVVVGSYTVQTSLLNERKQQTQAFVMSLPVTPMDYYWSKLIANLVIYLVPLGLVVGGMIGVIVTTAIPDGVVVWTTLIGLFLLTSFVASLGMAITVASEGWNLAMTIALMTLVGPYILWVTRMPGLHEIYQGEQILFQGKALMLILVELVLIAAIILVTGALHARKRTFL